MMSFPIRFTPENVAALKKALRSGHPQVKSSHFDEAIAVSFGFNSHAAMRPILYEVSRYARLVVNADIILLLTRLKELGYPDLSPLELRRQIWMTTYPHGLNDDQSGNAASTIYRPVAANV